MKLVQAIIPAGLIWIGGSFCTPGTKPPYDVDVVIRPTDIAALDGVQPEARMQLYALLTLKRVDVQDPPVYLSRHGVFLKEMAAQVRQHRPARRNPRSPRIGLQIVRVLREG